LHNCASGPALLPLEAAQAIRQITGNTELQTLDERIGFIEVFPSKVNRPSGL